MSALIDSLIKEQIVEWKKKGVTPPAAGAVKKAIKRAKIDALAEIELEGLGKHQSISDCSMIWENIYDYIFLEINRKSLTPIEYQEARSACKEKMKNRIIFSFAPND